MRASTLTAPFDHMRVLWRLIVDVFTYCEGQAVQPCRQSGLDGSVLPSWRSRQDLRRVSSRLVQHFLPATWWWGRKKEC